MVKWWGGGGVSVDGGGGRGCKIISFELMMFIGHGMQRVSKATFRGLAFRQRS